MAREECGDSFVKGLGVLSATNIVIGSMIGSGIFIAPSLMAGYIQTPGLLVMLWLIGGVLTICGALSLSELASAYPHVGGQYVFLREIYSSIWGFLYGWTVFLVIQTGFIAAIAIAFAKYLGVFFPALGEAKILFSFQLFAKNFAFSSAQLVSIICIALLTYVNVRGVRAGALVQNIFTFSKMGALLILIGAAFFFGSGSFKNFLPLLKPMLPAGAQLTLFAALAVAMSKALFAYDSWNSVTFVAGEMKNPQKNLPLSMLIGTGATTLIYVLTTMAFVYMVPIFQMSKIKENLVAAVVAQSVMGQAGLVFITVAVLISTFGCINGLILSGARLYYAMAHDGVFFKKNCLIHEKYRTPHVALIYQGVWSCVLVLSGTYSDLLTYTAFASLLFNVMTIIGVIVLRYRKPDLPRPYRVSGYPLVPLLYIAIALFFIVYIVIGDPLNSGKGLFLILAGIPVYAYWNSKRKAASCPPAAAR